MAAPAHLPQLLVVDDDEGLLILMTETLRAEGCAVLLVSEDLDELLALSDRVVVLNSGRIGFDTARPSEDRDRIGRAMGGHADATTPADAAPALH